VLVRHLLYRYGASTGAPTEQNIYADVEAAWRCLTERYGVAVEQIVLYGQSIGTVPTVDLASRVKVAGVVLHSPLTSGVRVAFPDTKQTWFFDAFPRLVNYVVLHYIVEPSFWEVCCSVYVSCCLAKNKSPCYFFR